MEIYRMKKSLLALAALSAIAGAAQAQSSVTVYGILDVGFVGSAYNGTATTANAATTGGPTPGALTSKQSTAGFGQSAESTSRIGFKGTEDLGAGTQALFTLELGLSPDSNGAAYSSTTGLSQPAVFGQVNRQTFVGLHKNGVGAATIGTQYTPLFDVQSATDAAGNNNLVGNAVYSGSMQSSTGTFNGGQGAYTTTTAGLNEASSAYTTRVSNALKLQSDRVRGLQGELFYAQSNQNQTQTGTSFAGTSTGVGGTNNNTAWGLNLDYVWNKLQVVAATQNVKSYDPAYAPVATTPQTGATMGLAAGTANSFGSNASDQQTYAAATYDFGILKAYGQFITRRVVSQVDGTYTTSRSAYQIGARSQLTPVISAYATMGLGKSQYLGQGNLGNNNFRTFQIGSDYSLSKRTNLYAAYGSFNQSSAGGSTVTAPNVGVSGMNYALGVRHTF
jgi:predicted porin